MLDVCTATQRTYCNHAYHTKNCQACEYSIITVYLVTIIPVTNSGMNNNALHITTSCNGLSTLNAVGKYIFKVKTKDKHTDIVSITPVIWASEPFYFTS